MKRQLIFLLLIALGANLKAQDILIPYREGKLWGFCNETGKVIIQPEYDSVDYGLSDPSDRYGVMKNGLWGIVSSTKTIIKPTLHVVNYYYSSFIIDVWQEAKSLKKSNLLVYDNQGRKIFSDTLLEFDFIHTSVKAPMLLIITKKSGLKSVCSYDYKLGKIGQWLAKDVKYIDSYYETENSDEAYYNDDFEEIIEIIPSDEDVENQEAEQIPKRIFLKIGDNQPTIFEVKYDVETAKFQLIEVDRDQSRKLRNANDPYFYYGEGVYDEAPDAGAYAVDQLYELYNDSLFLMTYSAHYNWHRKQITKEFIIGPNNIKLQPLMMPKETINIYYVVVENNRSSSFRLLNYIEYKVGDKIGMQTPFAVIKAQFDTVVGISVGDGNLPRFIVGIKNQSTDNMKFGMIDFKGDTLLPIEYDEIKIDTGAKYEIMHYVILTKNEKQSILYRSLNPMIENSYDEIIPVGAGYHFVLRNGKLYGYYAGAHEYMEPTFKYIPKGFKDFGSYEKRTSVVELFNDKNRFLGYANRNGLLYFKD